MMAELWNGCRVTIKDGWLRNPDEEKPPVGTALGEPVFVEQWWLPVKWDDEEDPNWFKLAGAQKLPEPPPMLSTGEPSTLGAWRDLSAAVFGEGSSPVKFLDGKIAEQGRDEIVVADERQMLGILGQMFVKEVRPPGA